MGGYAKGYVQKVPQRGDKARVDTKGRRKNREIEQSGLCLEREERTKEKGERIQRLESLDSLQNVHSV